MKKKNMKINAKVTLEM